MLYEWKVIEYSHAYALNISFSLYPRIAVFIWMILNYEKKFLYWC